MASTRILIVEDEGLTAAHLRKSLEALGYSVPGVVASGEEAIEQAGEVNPDLVLMDIILKGKMDGVQAAEEIRARYRIPIVYLTASSDNSTFQRAKGTDPFGYIIKPFEERSLHTTIQIALNKHEMEAKVSQRADELEALYAASRILSQPWSFEEKCKGIMEALAQIAKADKVVMRVYDSKTESMHMAAVGGPANWKRPESVPAENSISGQAFNSRAPVVVDDYPSHPMADSEGKSQGIRSVVSVPIRAARWTLGVIDLASIKPSHFQPRLVSLLSGIADGLGTL